ncbi:MAG: hypothetical protein HC871_15610 [Rhizobiales bacterium]|nr:hypothetical protein [Hyphomicrobiales bacterium]
MAGLAVPPSANRHAFAEKIPIARSSLSRLGLGQPKLLILSEVAWIILKRRCQKKISKNNILKMENVAS